MARRSAAARADEVSDTGRRSRRRLTVVENDGYADLDSVREFAAELPEKYLHCRELGHNWRPFSAGRHPDGGFERVLKCSRCRTRREQSLDSYGHVMTNNYIHPEGYLAQGMGRIVGDGRGLLRLESITRLVKEVD